MGLNLNLNNPRAETMNQKATGAHEFYSGSWTEFLINSYYQILASVFFKSMLHPHQFCELQNILQSYSNSA